MMPGTMQFTLRGIPLSPAARQAGQPRGETGEPKASHSSGAPAQSGAPDLPRGWIDMLLGETPLESLYPDEQ